MLIVGKDKVVRYFDGKVVVVVGLVSFYVREFLGVVIMGDLFVLGWLLLLLLGCLDLLLEIFWFLRVCCVGLFVGVVY